MGLFALLGLLQAAPAGTVPEEMRGTWFPTGEIRAMGATSIQVDRDGVILMWRGERSACTVAPGTERIVAGPVSAILLTCPTSSGNVRLGLTGPSVGLLIVHLIAPGSDELHVFVANRGARGAPGPPKPSSDQMPQFPWPPPQPSSRTVLPRGLAVVRDGETLGTIFDRLDRAMARAGMRDWSVYAVGADGFAIIARLENIDDNGRPTQRRFQDPMVHPQIFSLSDLLIALFRARPGRYRVIGLVVTARPVTTGPSVATPEMIGGLLARGAGALPEALSKTPLPPSGRCEAFVYEFFRATEDKEPAQVPYGTSLMASEHLVGAGLWRAEELR
jgi:hypothetical protein